MATVQSPSLVRTEGRGEESAVIGMTNSSRHLPVILALVVIGAFAGIAVWGVVAVLQAKRLTESQRMIGVGGIVVVMALLAVWVIFFWPAYWD